MYLNDGRATIERTLIADNGGGVFTFVGRLEMRDSSVLRNGSGVRVTGSATIERCTIAENTGDGIEASRNIVASGPARARVINSTVSGNSGGLAGGVYVGNRGRVTLSNVTVAGNNGGAIGGVFLQGDRPRLILGNTLIADNTGAPFLCRGEIRSRGFNLIEDAPCPIKGRGTGDLIGVDPELGPLADNGGPTETHALLAGSPAVDAGNPRPPRGRGTSCTPTDQRGIARIGPCDIGAYEAP